MTDADEQHGQRAARFGDFVTAHRSALVRVAVGVLGDAAEAEDVVQETLANVWRQATPPDDLAAYAFRAVRLNALKRRERRRPRPLPLAAAGEVPDVSESSSYPSVDPLEMERAIERLPAAQQAIVRMRYYLGLSLAEAARSLSISSNTAASRCRYALATLRRLLTRP